MRPHLLACLLLCVGSVPLAAQQGRATQPPPWDARGLGPLPRMGVTSLDVSAPYNRQVENSIRPDPEKAAKLVKKVLYLE